MKKILLSLMLAPLLAFAQDPDDAVFRLQNNPPTFTPFSVTASYTDVSRTHFKTPGFTEDQLKFQQWEAAVVYTHLCTPCAGLIFGAGWIGNEVDMQNNPEFNETIFNYVNLSMGVVTQAFHNWTWTVTLAAYLDTEEFSFVDYALYQGVIWGQFQLCKWVELDFGVIVEAGLNHDKVWPILGFIYIPSEKWQINAVYPIDISLEYFINDAWTVSGSMRLFRTRHRVKDSEPNPQGIFEYRTNGIELDLTYAPFAWLAVTGFAGSTTSGDLKISDRNDNNSTHYKFHGSFYAGAYAILSF